MRYINLRFAYLLTYLLTYYEGLDIAELSLQKRLTKKQKSITIATVYIPAPELPILEETNARKRDERDNEKKEKNDKV